MAADWEVCPAGTMAALKRAIDELRSAREILADVIEMARRERQADEHDPQPEPSLCELAGEIAGMRSVA